MPQALHSFPPPRRAAPAALPAHVAPMLATLAHSLPSAGSTYLYEYKWDGVRALAYIQQGRLALESRNLNDITASYPELAALLPALNRRSLLLDGEIVALGPSGTPDFSLLQRRMHVRGPSPALVARVPVAFMLFDVLHLDGRSLLDLPCAQRREILESLPIARPATVPPAVAGDGTRLLEAARDMALEGVVAKRRDSAYEPGRRSGAWLKIKIIQTTELVIGGWMPERSSRGHARVGALLLGYFETAAATQLTFAGAVGTGFTDDEHARLVPRLKKLAAESSPFTAPLPRGRGPARVGIVFTKPSLVAQVEYRRWFEGGLMQQAAYKGLRNDKPARSIVRETVKG